MKTKQRINNTKLGLFVLAGVSFLVFSLYMIGRNRNLFGSTFTVSAYFRNINGLVPGNNVRFSGIDVGTVQSVSVENDTSVLVIMIVDKKMRKHIKINSLASIGTDGLVGNKLVNINSVVEPSPPIEDGGKLSAMAPVETDEMLRTLQTTNKNIAVITENLKDVSVRLNGSSTLWNILADTVIAHNLKDAASHFNQASLNTELATSDARQTVNKLSKGDGMVQAIFTDTLLRKNLEQSLHGLQHTGESLEIAAQQLKELTHDLNDRKGSIGVLLSDTATAQKLKQSISNIEQGSGRFSENMEALKRNVLLRKYYRKQKKTTKGK